MTPKTESWILIGCSVWTAACAIYLAAAVSVWMVRIDGKLDWLLSRQPPAAQVDPAGKP